MIEGTKVLWSFMVYVPMIILSAFFLKIFGPMIAPFEETSKLAPTGFLIGLGIVVVIAAPIALRYQVWQPLHRLARDCGDPRLFRAHCKRIAFLALPYAPLLAVPMALLCLNFGGWVMWLQIAVIIGAEHIVDKWRQRPIVESVDAVLALS